MKARKFFGLRLIAHNSWFLTNWVISVITALLLNLFWITTSLADVSIPPEVADEIQQNDTVRLIIGLDVSWKPEGKAKTPAAEKRIKKQREFIKLAQDEFEQRLNQGLFASSIIRKKDSLSPIIKKFSTIPYVAMEGVDSKVLSYLEKIPGIKQIELDIPDEIFLSDSVSLIGAEAAWQSGYTGEGQTVVILDTGVDKTHPQLAGKIIKELCFSKNCPDGSSQQEGDGAALPCSFSVYCDHGTHVAGIVTGVATGTKVIATQIFSNYYSMPASFASDQIAALEWVYLNHDSINPPIAAINMSLGGGQYTAPCDSDSRTAIIKNLKAVNIATLVASGNSGYIDAMSAPACISSAISVGATDKDDNVAYFSNSASFLDVLAPGVDILSTIPGGEMGYKSGTSMATPHVTGTWAILKSMYPTATIDSLLTDLKNNGVSITDSRNNITKSRIDLVAFLSSQEYPLVINPSSNGIVSSSDEVIACGGSNNNCVANYSSGQAVTLQALADTGFAFKNWGIDCVGTTDSLTVTMNAAKTCAATFTPVYSLTITSPSNGKVTSQDGYINCGNSQCSKEYQSGQLVTIEAIANSGYQFKQWEGDCNGTANPITLTMDSTQTCTATFQETSPNTIVSLAINKSGGGLGVVKAYLAGKIDFACKTNCLDYTKDYPAGTQIELVAYKSGTDSTWGGWSGDCSGGNKILVTLDTATNCTAHFNTTTTTYYPLTVNVTGSGKVSSSDGAIDCSSSNCVANYLDGQTVTLQATANTDNQFKQWGGNCSGTTNPITVTMNNAKMCSATFETTTLSTYPLTVNVTGSGKVSSSDGAIDCSSSNCVANYSDGQTVTLEATADPGNQFKQWGGNCSGTTNPITVTMDSAQTCTATFQEIPAGTIVSLTINKEGEGLGIVKAYLAGQIDFACKTNCPDYTKDYPAGTQIELVAYKSGTDSKWGGWSGDCSGGNKILVTLDTATKCIAHFNLVTQ